FQVRDSPAAHHDVARDGRCMENCQPVDAQKPHTTLPTGVSKCARRVWRRRRTWKRARSKWSTRCCKPWCQEEDVMSTIGCAALVLVSGLVLLSHEAF